MALKWIFFRLGREVQFTNLLTALRRFVFFNSTLIKFNFGFLLAILFTRWVINSWLRHSFSCTILLIKRCFSKQVSLYKGGEQTGPAKFTWPNGAIREGSKVKISTSNYVHESCPVDNLHPQLPT